MDSATVMETRTALMDAKGNRAKVDAERPELVKRISKYI
jgi:hypothetical protein